MGIATINLIGKNVIEGTDSICQYGIYASDDLTIKGGGSLYISNTDCGIYSKNSNTTKVLVLSVEDTNIQINSHSVLGNPAIDANRLYIKNSNINVKANETCGVFALNELKVSDSIFNIQAGTYAFFCPGELITIEGYKSTGYKLMAGANAGTAKEISLNKIMETGYAYIGISFRDFKKMSGPVVTVAKKGFTISWQQVSGAEGYKLYKSTDGKKYSLLSTLKSQAATSYLDKSLKNGKKYYYCVEPYASKITGVKSSSTMTYYLTRPTIKSAKNVAGKKITVQLKAKNSKATGYQIQYVTGNKTKTLKVKGTKTLKKTITKLKKGKSYKVSVRFYKTLSKKTYYSAYSAVKTVKVKK